MSPPPPPPPGGGTVVSHVSSGFCAVVCRKKGTDKRSLFKTYRDMVCPCHPIQSLNLTRMPCVPPCEAHHVPHLLLDTGGLSDNPMTNRLFLIKFILFCFFFLKNK